jgi:hypothetical protein
MKSVAESKKSKNVGEYIIYMYQMEDLIRSYQFDLQDIRQYVISHYPVSEHEKSQIASWFETLSAQMIAEGIQEKGHLSHVQKEVDQLALLHWDLLKKDREYFEIYHPVKSHILEYISSAGGKDPGHEIQICINGIYGLLLCRLTGQNIPDNIKQSTEDFGSLLSYLSLVYKEKNGGG